MTRSRLTPERESELYGAVLDLLREVGYDSLTMDAVAARTRSSKATLYRQWHSKPELVARSLQQVKPSVTGEIDTGSLRGDFHEMMSRADDEEMERDSALMRGLLQAVHNNPDLYDALRKLLIEPEMQALRTLVERAVERGEISADNPAVDFIPHMLFGSFFARQMIEDKVPDRCFLTRYMDSVVLRALGV
ncbi:TetR/AcrR family transcriptional regulator [Streptomyces sp. NPDC020965]|uniref:TetR/AcrR family transcriptional regulator n=1 Tax=Streptomyces sp. NPDC020965 TaxID=3365105 RepID=UPI0037B31997